MKIAVFGVLFCSLLVTSWAYPGKNYFYVDVHEPNVRDINYGEVKRFRNIDIFSQDNAKPDFVKVDIVYDKSEPEEINNNKNVKAEVDIPVEPSEANNEKDLKVEVGSPVKASAANNEKDLKVEVGSPVKASEANNETDLKKDIGSPVKTSESNNEKDVGSSDAVKKSESNNEKVTDLNEKETKVDINANVEEKEENIVKPIEKEPDTNDNVDSPVEEENVEPIVPILKADNNENLGRVLYNGAQILKVTFHERKILKELQTLYEMKEISWWGGNKTTVDMLVRSGSVKKVKSLLEREHVPYTVIIEDLQDAIDHENPIIEEDEELTNRKGHRLTWSAYHRFDDIMGYIDYLAKTYPNICSVKTIGSSVEGRPLRVLRISNGNPSNKAIWIDGGMHAREWISPATVTYIINQIAEDYESNSQLFKNIDWYILPVANPDGYEYTHVMDRLWRKNRSGSGRCSGTDLNRNFGYRWGGKGNSKNPCAETYGGSSAFSEPETRAIKNFFESSGADFQAYVSFHSYGQYILYPWGYDKVVPPDYKDLESVGQKIAQAIRGTGGFNYKVGAAANTLYPASGGSDDWAKGILKIKYAYTIELRDSGRYGFILPANYIVPTATEAFAGVKVVAEAIS